MVSIITPFYQSEKYIGSAIRSVLDQTYQEWELLLVNDGSTDDSKEIALNFPDARIRYFEQENKGVSSARNVGLANMSGNYFCFLDADDVLPNNSLLSRIKIFDSNPEISFVDGQVLKMNENLSLTSKIWLPQFNGNPFKDLISLSGKSFLGLTWMIKRCPNSIYQFEPKLTHSEDLYFYMKLAKKGGLYGYTNQKILQYRGRPNSAMTNLEGLEKGYRFIEKRIKNWDEVDHALLSIYQYRYRRAMFLAYLRSFQPFSAIKSIF